MEQTCLNDHSPNTLLLVLLELWKLSSWVTTDGGPEILQGRLEADAKDITVHFIHTHKYILKWWLTHGTRAQSSVLLCTWLLWCAFPCYPNGSCSLECFWSAETGGNAGNGNPQSQYQFWQPIYQNDWHNVNHSMSNSWQSDKGFLCVGFHVVPWSFPTFPFLKLFSCIRV